MMENITIKINVIGESGVGKRRLFEGKNVSDMSNWDTQGIEFYRIDKNIQGIKFRNLFWVINPAEEKKDIRKSWYIGAFGVIVVCDVNQKETINKTLIWISVAIQYVYKDSPLIILGNKSPNQEKEKFQTRILYKTQISNGINFNMEESMKQSELISPNQAISEALEFIGNNFVQASRKIQEKKI